MNVLSLFDGISCAQIALNKIGIKPTNYYASEFDSHCIAVTQDNYPNTIQLGDVTKWREWGIDWASIDLLIGGSPCQGFSFAGKQLAFDDPRSKLFFEYLNILEHLRSFNPDIRFLLENVKMKKDVMDAISGHMGVQPVFINSELLTAQSRQRNYWCNWGITQPDDAQVLLKDVIEDGWVDRDKSYCIDANYWKGGNRKSYFEKSRRQLVFNNENMDTYRKLSPRECERLQTVPVGYTDRVSNTQRYKQLGNAFTVDVIAHILSQSGMTASPNFY